ncbi:MAG: hypothetical protein LAO78_11735 [Acidobacteriia bacterium]|nr:hypothetical protein [Terriglobia bacterium]
MKTASVELHLDVRGLRKRTGGPQDILDAWNSSVAQIFGRTLHTGDSADLLLPDHRKLSYFVISTPAPVVVTDQTDFSIYSLTEVPNAYPPCRYCARVDQRRAGFFKCDQCKEERGTGLCFDHVRLLRNAIRKSKVIATCEEHLPKCECNERAEFWCLGPGCGGRVAWCSRHQMQHPTSREVYCSKCYQQIYPACAVGSCNEVAHNRCEHVDPAVGEPCGRSVCNIHVTRWQVFGYEKIGLARCQQHRGIRALSDLEVAWQLVAGTALRHLRGAQNKYNLPTLPSLKNILLKARRQKYSARSVLVFFLTVEDQLKQIRQASSLHRKMQDLITRARPRWKEQVETEEKEINEGMLLMERLKAILAQSGMSDFISVIELSDYRPRFFKGPTPRPALFVRLPQHLVPRFIGKDGVKIKGLSQRLGVEVKIERLA